MSKRCCCVCRTRGGTLALLGEREIGLGPRPCGFRRPHPRLAAQVAQQQQQVAGDHQFQQTVVAMRMRMPHCHERSIDAIVSLTR